MANVRLIPYADIVSGTWTASSADGNFPATNLGVVADLRKWWQALVATGVVDLTFDCGVGNTIAGLAAVPGLFVDWANVASITVQGNSVTTNWTTPPWSQPATLTTERWTGRRKGFWKLSELNAAAFSYRYLNVQIQSQTPDDGQNYHVSRIIVGSITELTVGFMYEPKRRAEQATERTRRLDGSVQITQLGEPLMAVTLPRMSRDAASLNEQLDLERASVDPLVFWDAALGGSESAWIIQRLDDTDLTQRFNAVHNSQMQFREVG